MSADTAADAPSFIYIDVIRPATPTERVWAKSLDLCYPVVALAPVIVVLVVCRLSGMQIESAGRIAAGVAIAAYFAIHLANLTRGGSPGKRSERLRVYTNDKLPAPFLYRLARWAVQSVVNWSWAVVLMIGESGKLKGLIPPDAPATLMLVSLICVAVNLLLIAGTGRALHDLASATFVGATQVRAHHNRSTAFEVIVEPSLTSSTSAASSSPLEGPTGTGAAPAGSPDSPAPPVA